MSGFGDYLEKKKKEQAIFSPTVEIQQEPDPVQLEKELIEPLKEGKELNCPMIEELFKDRDKYAMITELGLAYEGPLNFFDFFKDKKAEYEKKYKPYVDAMISFTNLADLYASAKYGVKINAARNAVYSRIGADYFTQKTADMGKAFVDLYSEAFKKYKESAGK